MQFSRISQIWHELRSVLRGYPDFVFSARARDLVGHVPVFVYHSIEPTAFERDLRFLVDNGYRTLAMVELVDALRSGATLPARTVVLTFDDGRSSFWRYAYPLLLRYAMKGVLFIIPGMTGDDGDPRDNLFSVWSGRRTGQDIHGLDPDDVGLCTWPELREMQSSGVVEVESHSLFHREVFVNDRVLGFLTPASSYVPYQTPATAYLSTADGGQCLRPERFYGLPLFRPRPLHQGERAWVLDAEGRCAARSMYQALCDEWGDERLTQRCLRDQWRANRLGKHLRRQSAQDVENDIAEDIAVARDLIRARVSPEAGDHFCLPYSVGSDVTVRALQANGVMSCAWGVIPGKRSNRRGDDSYRICRVKSDFLWRLPGLQRRTLVGVYGGKMGRRLRGEPVY